MTAVQTPLAIRLTAQLPPAYAGDWLSLPLELSNPADAPGPVCVRRIACENRAIQIDSDLFQPDFELRPGETYRVALPILATHPCELDLSSFFVQIDGPVESVHFPQRLVQVAPSLAKELELTVKPLCAYETGTKVQLTWHHTGATRFEEFAVALGPADAVLSGKATLRLKAFGPGDSDEAEVVVRGETLDVLMSARSAAGPVEVRRTLKVVPPPRPGQRPRFRFLAPRRLASDNVTVHQVKGGLLVAAAGGCFPVHAGLSYHVTIRPQSPGVSAISLRDIPGRVVVRKPEGDCDGHSWKFQVEINVLLHEWFTRPERLDYSVQGKDGPLAGEIHVRVKPPRWKHLGIAAAFGAALTAQGAIALGRLLLHPEFSLEQLWSDFKVARDYPVFFLLAVPAVWLGLFAVDRFLWRVRD
jgi:hypothetical protein